MILFFDTETTGLPKNWKAPVTELNNWPRMVQLAYLLFDTNGNKISGGDFIIKPNGFTIPNDASQIHGISNERAIRDGVQLESVLKEFETLIGQATFIVAHNISFDEKIVGAEFLRCNMTNSLNSIRKICTMESSTNFCAIDGPYGYKWPKLSELHYKLFKTNFEEAHNAAIDITATAKCFWELTRKGVIKFQSENNPDSEVKVAQRNDTNETNILRKQVEEYCNENGFKEIPLGAKAEAIMYLNFKFKQLDLDTDIEDEFIFLRDYWRKNDSNLMKTTVNSLQNDFLLMTKKRIIEEHKTFSLFNDEKNKTIDDKIMQLEVLSLIKANDTKKYRDLVIHLYYYYLSAYKDFLPDNKKPKDNNEPQKADYSGVSDVAKRSHQSFEKLISEFGEQIDKTTNGNIPESIYYLVNNCNKELAVIGSELGNKHKIYTDSSNLIVKLSTNLISEWIKANAALLNISIQGMKLGNTFLEVCNSVFEAIDKIEVDINTKEWFNKRKASFASLKESLEPKSGCYIATMTYGDYNHPQVIHLRRFRDQNLKNSILGRLFIKFYYATSPNIVKLCKDNKFIIKISRTFLDTFIKNFLHKDTI